MFALSDDTRKDLSGIDIEAAREELRDLREIEKKVKVTEYTLELYKSTLQESNEADRFKKNKYKKLPLCW